MRITELHGEGEQSDQQQLELLPKGVWYTCMLNLLSMRDVLTRHDHCHCDTRDVLERHESVRNYIDPAFLPWHGVELYRCTEDS